MVTHITSSKQKLYWSEVGIQDKDQSRWFNQQIQARLVVKGYKQKEGEDFREIFALVSRLDTVWLIISLAAQKNWKIYQMDVKSAFLNGYLEEEIFIDQPPGFVKEGEEHKVYKLRKALYGLKQSPRAWYSRINAYFEKHGF